MKKYPKEIYVQREEDGKDSYLLAWEKAEEANDGDVAIYQLVAVKVKSTTTNISVK